MSKKKIRVMLLDDHPAIRHGIAMAINLEDDLIVSAESSNVEEAMRILAKGKIDVVLVDISLEGSADGFDFIKAAAARYVSVKTLALSMYDEAVYAEKAIMAGAMGYLSKKEPVDEIINAIREVIKGNLYLTGDLSEKLILKLMKRGNEDGTDSHGSLSPRERDILGFIGAGYTPREIAHELKLSINTVETHRKNLKEKLGFNSSSELVKYAIKFTDN